MNEIPFWITATHWASRFVLVLLALLSIWSVATMIRCYRWLQKARGADAGEGSFSSLQAQLRAGQLKAAGGEPSLYQAVVSEAKNYREPLTIDRSVKSLLTLKKSEIESGLTILATLGANAPFIGLFGTVLGIIQAFGALGASQSSGSSVMAGISESLVATAVGLFVAIPAVVAFNFLSRGLRLVLSNCEALRDLYIAQLKG